MNEMIWAPAKERHNAAKYRNRDPYSLAIVEECPPVRDAKLFTLEHIEIGVGRGT